MTDRTTEQSSGFRRELLEALRQETERKSESRAALSEKVRLEAGLLERARTPGDRRAEERLDLARRIFARLEALRCDRELGNRLGRLKDVCPANFSQGLFINGWRWAHTPKAGGEENWSRTYLRESAGRPELYYSAGYGWFGSGPQISARTPEELAEAFSLEYLRQLDASFEDGSVYDAIRRWHTGPRRPGGQA